MGIKKITKLSFIVITTLIIALSLISMMILSKNKDNQLARSFISELIIIQDNMNDLVLDSILVNDQDELNKVKKLFIEEEEKFEDIKKAFLADIDHDFFDLFIEDFHYDESIQKDIELLHENEKALEDAFDKIYELQKEKIFLKNSFAKDYPSENKLRKALQKIVWSSTDPQIIKEFADLKYYSKEALYQHKNEEYLKKWLDKAILLKEKTDIKMFDDYIVAIKHLTEFILRLNEVELSENALIQKVQKITNQNRVLNAAIEKTTQKIFTDFLSSNNSIIMFVMLISIAIVIVVAMKVSKNIDLSVDEIETKVDEATQEIQNLNKEIETTQKEVVFTMGAIGESRSKETGNHVKRVAEYSKLLGLYYGLSEDEAEMLKQASPMHDIGKVAIPDAVLNKPGRFDEAERAIMDTHAKLGYDMLVGSNRPLLKAAATVAYEHHEKWDGSGYPRGLKGEDIHIYGRITALADVFDALGSDRVYKKAWDDERIFKLFKEERAKHFDPKLIDIFFEHLDKFLEIRDKFKDV